MQSVNYSFRETSRLFRPAFLFSFLPVFVIMAWLFFDQRAKRDNLGVILSIVTIVICIAALCFMFLLKLTTKITDEGIAFKYAPTMRQFKIYPWEQIASVSIVSYNPLQDFAGWGLKKSKKYGKGYTTKGNKGLWIQLTDSKAFFSPFLQRTKLVHTSRRKNFILFPETVIDVVKPHVVFIYASPSNVKSAYL